MMALGLGYFAHAIDKRQGLLEVGKAKDPVKMMLVDHAPLRHVVVQG